MRMVASLLVLSVFALLNAQCQQEEPIATAYKRSLVENEDGNGNENGNGNVDKGNVGENPKDGTDEKVTPPSDQETKNTQPKPDTMDPGKKDETSSPNPETPASNSGEEPKLVGDPAKGKTILTSTCQALCHTPTGPAKKVILNAKIIGDLDVAIQLPMYKVYHDGIKTNFEGQNRADLEAALKTIP